MRHGPVLQTQSGRVSLLSVLPNTSVCSQNIFIQNKNIYIEREKNNCYSFRASNTSTVSYVINRDAVWLVTSCRDLKTFVHLWHNGKVFMSFFCFLPAKYIIYYSLFWFYKGIFEWTSLKAHTQTYELWVHHIDIMHSLTLNITNVCQILILNSNSNPDLIPFLNYKIHSFLIDPETCPHEDKGSSLEIMLSPQG